MTLSPSQYRQFLLLSIVTPIVSAILLFFAFYNAVVLERFIVSAISAFTGTIFLFAHLYFRRDHKLTFASNLMLLGFITFLIVFNIENKNLGFGLVWTVIFPLLAITATGTRQGLLFSLLMYFVTLFILIDGLGVWLNGLWDHTGLLRFTIAYLGITYMTYVLDHFNEVSFQKLQSAHKKELQHLEELKTMAITDSLTGLYNRHHLTQTTQNLSSKMLEQSASLVFFILDLDCFKPYNDTYGHLKGDKALKQVADTIQQQVNSISGDAYRVGGEEFAGVIVTQDIESTVEKIEEIGDLIKQLNIQHEQSKFEVLTTSIGIIITDQYQKFNFDDIYKTADIALYQAKAEGRNRCVIVDQRQL